MKKIRQRKRDIVDSFRGGSERRLKEAGVDVLMGEGAFVDERTVRVMFDGGEEKVVTADRIFVNTGERPAPPKLEGVEKMDPRMVLDSTSIQELDEVPEHLVVIGGGYVGVEFAQLMRRLGARVSVLQRGKQLLPREDPEIAKCLFDILKEDGLDVVLESQAVRIEPHGEGFKLKYQEGKGGPEKELIGSHILFAAGRIPNTEALDLSAAGIKTNSKVRPSQPQIS